MFCQWYLYFVVFILTSDVDDSMAQNVIDDSELWDLDISHLGHKIFGKPNANVGKKLENWTPESGRNPEELGEYAEGDILFPYPTGYGLAAKSSRWKGGVVPYETSSNFTTKDKAMIKKAMDIYHKYTCIRFRPRIPSDVDYLSIVNNPTGCWAAVGRRTGRQEINLQSPYCTYLVGTSLHELGHAIGILHEHNRQDRDNFITIVWENVHPGKKFAFHKDSKSSRNSFGVNYDYLSVMHYSEKAFSINKLVTIIPKQPAFLGKLGQRRYLSNNDITKINRMYECFQSTTNNPPTNNFNPNCNANFGGR